MSLPRVAVIGVGGVGGILAAALETAGASEVTLVARGAALASLASPDHGLRAVLCDGTRVDVAPRRVVDADALLARAGRDPHDFVLLCTKAHQLASARSSSAISSARSPSPNRSSPFMLRGS